MTVNCKAVGSFALTCGQGSMECRLTVAVSPKSPQTLQVSQHPVYTHPADTLPFICLLGPGSLESSCKQHRRGNSERGEFTGAKRWSLSQEPPFTYQHVSRHWLSHQHWRLQHQAAIRRLELERISNEPEFQVLGQFDNTSVFLLHFCWISSVKIYFSYSIFWLQSPTP